MFHQARKPLATLSTVAFLLFSCAAAPPPAATPIVFDAPLDRVWSVAVATLKEENTIRLLDRTSAIMETQLAPIHPNELPLIRKRFWNKDYRRSFSLTFRALSRDATEVGVVVDLRGDMLGVRGREAEIKSVLRQRVCDRIAVNLAR